MIAHRVAVAIILDGKLGERHGEIVAGCGARCQGVYATGGEQGRAGAQAGGYTIPTLDGHGHSVGSGRGGKVLHPVDHAVAAPIKLLACRSHVAPARALRRQRAQHTRRVVRSPSGDDLSSYQSSITRRAKGRFRRSTGIRSSKGKIDVEIGHAGARCFPIILPNSRGKVPWTSDFGNLLVLRQS